MNLLIISFLCIIWFRSNKAYFHYYDLTDVEEKEMFEEHNIYRRTVNAKAMFEMRWNKTLSRYAKLWAQKCTIETATVLNNTIYSVVGQNIYSYISNDQAFKPYHLKALKTWFDEELNFYNFVCRPGHNCNHYTQIVWFCTTDVGCGRHQCNQTVYIVCEYYPKGNVPAQDPYLAGESCIECEKYNYKYCNDKLCTNFKNSALWNYSSWVVLAFIVLFQYSKQKNILLI